MGGRHSRHHGLFSANDRWAAPAWPSIGRPALRVVEQRHEAEVHVQLLMAVEEGATGIIGDKIDLSFLVAPEHHDILENAGSRFSREARHLEAVAMQMNRVNIIARIPQANAITLAFLEMKRRWD